MITKADIEQARDLWHQSKERTQLALGKLEIVQRAMRELTQHFKASTVTASSVSAFEKSFQGATQELQSAVQEQDRTERQYSLLRDKFDEQSSNSSQPS